MLAVPLLASWCMTSASILCGLTLGISVLFSLAHFQISRLLIADNIVVLEGVFVCLVRRLETSCISGQRILEISI